MAARFRRLPLLLAALPLLAAARLALSPDPSHGIELWSASGGERFCALDGALKWTWLLSRATRDPVLFPEPWSGTGLWRGRLTLRAQPTTWLHTTAAYEQRLRLVSEGSGAAGGTGILLAEDRAPHRLRQIDAALVEVGDSFAHRHELDRALASLHLGQAEITVGRQAIGWGRGVLFAAVDFFAPFTPLESDREWRRGIDAGRARLPLTDLFSLDAVAALGESVDASSFVGRVQGYVGDVDTEIIVGRRFRDYVGAATASLPVGGAELHGELALFKIPEPMPENSFPGGDDLVAKVVAGGSYTADVARGLWILAEYHYSGFGARRIRDVVGLMMDPVFRARHMRGDSQILSRHAGGLQLVYGIGELLPVQLSWVVSPADGSGVVAPAASLNFSDNVTLIASGYVGHGAGPRNGLIRSEYGATPTSGLLQISFYY